MRGTLLPALAAVVLCAATAAAQQSPPAGHSPSIVGTWRVVEFCNIDSTGKVTHSLGPTPAGLFVYGAAGTLSIQVMRAPASGPLVSDTVPLANLRALQPYYFGYFGTYTVTSDSTIIHHVQGATLANYIGTDQRRAYRIRGDTLSIGVAPLPYCRRLIRVR